MKYLRYSLFCILLPLVFSSGCKDAADSKNAAAQAYAINKEFYKGPLRVQVSISADKINLSDLLRIRLTAQIDPGGEVQFPAVSEKVKDFKLRLADPLTRKLSVGGKMAFEQVFELEPLKAGPCQIPAMTVTFTSNETSGELLTEPLDIEVATTLPQDAPLEIADIEDIVDIPPARWPLWAAGAALLAVLAAWILWACRPVKAAAVKRVYCSADRIALDKLRALAAEKLIEQGRIKEFYLKLSACLRQYIENRFALRAPEQTTEEFLVHLGSSDVLAGEHKQQLCRFLQHCDLVKFARYEPTAEQIHESMTMAEQFIESTRSGQENIDVTDTQEAA